MKASQEHKKTVDSVQMLRLLYMFGYYHPQKNPYLSRGICYGFAYTNAFALLLENNEVIEERANVLSLLDEKASIVAKEAIEKSSFSQDYQDPQNIYRNAINYLLIKLRSKHNDELMQILNELKEVLEDKCKSLLLQGENASVHLHAYFNTIKSLHINKITASRSFNKQNARDLLSLFVPVHYSQKALSVYTAETLAGVFNLQKLARLLFLFAENTNISKELSSPVVFILSGGIPEEIKYTFLEPTLAEHTILISFDPKEKIWSLLDSLTARLQTFTYTDTEALAVEIMKEFCLQKNLPLQGNLWRDFFIHTLCSQAHDLALINQVIVEIKQSNEWPSLIEACFQTNLHVHTQNMFKNCLLEGDALEIRSFFSDDSMQKLAPSIHPDRESVISYLLKTRYRDPEICVILKNLVESGVCVHLKNKAGQNALHSLVEQTWRNVKKYPIIPEAIMECFHYLLEQGIDINEQEPEGLHTPLSIALFHRNPVNPSLVEYLLKNKANPNLIVDRFMEHRLITTLVNNYMDPPIRSGNSDNLEAYNHSVLTTIKLLIKYGANLDLPVRNVHIRMNYAQNADNKISIIDHIQYSIKDNQQYCPEKALELQNILLAYTTRIENNLDLMSLEELQDYYKPVPLNAYEAARFSVSLSYNKTQNHWDPYNEVTDHLFLGRIIENESFLIPEGIKLIVSVVTYGELNTIQFPYAKLTEQGIHHIFVHMQDFDNKVAIPAAVKTIQTILEYLQSEKGVYIHCKAGRARSGLFAACVVAYQNKISLEEAIDDITAKRTQVDISESKRLTARTILDQLYCETQLSVPLTFKSADSYLASLQAKNELCQLPSFKLLANYLAGLRDTQNRFQYLSSFFQEILAAEDASWYEKASNQDPSSFLVRFAKANPNNFFKTDDSAFREQLANYFLTDVYTLIYCKVQYNEKGFSPF